MSKFQRTPGTQRLCRNWWDSSGFKFGESGAEYGFDPPHEVDQPPRSCRSQPGCERDRQPLPCVCTSVNWNNSRFCHIHLCSDPLGGLYTSAKSGVKVTCHKLLRLLCCLHEPPANFRYFLPEHSAFNV